MAENVYYKYKRFRKDLKKVRSGTHIIDVATEECMSFKSIGTGTTTFLLPDAIPGREHTFIVGTSELVILPQAADYLTTPDGGPLAIGEQIDSSEEGSNITYRCLRYGVWRCVNAVGEWGVEPVGERIFDETFDTTFE